MATKEQAIDILDKFDFFQGQRAGRELWNDKPFDVQEQDIAAFSRDVALLKEYINAADVALKSEVAREIFDAIERLMFATRMGTFGGHVYSEKLKDCVAELKKKYTEK